ncbi:DMT family transporter [soil metagenome]
MQSLPKQNTLVGIGLMLAAVGILPFLDVVAKFLGHQNVPVVQTVWARLMFSTLITIPFLLNGRTWRVMIPDQPWVQSLRGFLTVISTAFFFWALAYLPIADTLAIFFVQPLIVTALSPILLGEHVGLRRWLAVLTGFVGTLVIIRPGFAEINLGVVLALLSGAVTAFNMLLTRMVARRADPIANMFYASFSGMIFTTIAVPFYWQPPTQDQWQLFALLAVIGSIGHYLIITAYRHAEASLLAPLAYTEMIMAIAAGWWFFGDFPDEWTFLGLAILISSAIYISWRERSTKSEPVTPQP